MLDEIAVWLGVGRGVSDGKEVKVCVGNGVWLAVKV